MRYRPDKGRPGFSRVLEWEPLEFLERFAAIIPPPRKHLVRYYGALGPRSKIRRALTEAAKFPATLEDLQAGFAVEGLLAAAQSVARAVREAASKAKRAWAACLRRVFEVGPVLCEGCGGEMKLVTVIVDDASWTPAATTSARTGLPVGICPRKRVGGVVFCARFVPEPAAKSGGQGHFRTF